MIHISNLLVNIRAHPANQLNIPPVVFIQHPRKDSPYRLFPYHLPPLDRPPSGPG